jgi:predicted dehydrogenase
MVRRADRRRFLRRASLAGVGFWATGGLSRSQPRDANEKLNIAIVGAGGQGGVNLNAVSSENIVALCDVDDKRAASAFTKYPNVKKYTDFRKMLDEQKDIDAVVVSVPDHMHAQISIRAMRLGKHVYCEKPLAHSLDEVRLVRQTATRARVATQLGNHGTASAAFRQNVEIIQSGALGAIKEVHVWSNRPIWPQGMKERPRETPEPPASLEWDLWLGGAAARPYALHADGKPAYHPFNWRGWWDFGTGALGDMACHMANLPSFALKLGYPSIIEAESSGVSLEGPPKWSVIRYDFPARGDLPAVKLTWYDGGKKPGDDVLREVMKVIKDGKMLLGGCLIVGDKGQLFSPGDYGTERVLLPEDDFKDYTPPEPTLPRSPGHHKEWIAACKGGKPGLANFEYAGLLTEMILLGNVALRVGKRIEWDATAKKAIDCPEADKFLKQDYRKDWAL